MEILPLLALLKAFENHHIIAFGGVAMTGMQASTFGFVLGLCWFVMSS